MTANLCPCCSAPLVAARSHRVGLCTGCAAEADSTPTAPATGELVHDDSCTTAQVVEHETPRRRVLVCRTCAAHLVLGRVNRWRDHPTPGTDDERTATA